MRDVACAGYVAGANTRWFAKKDDGTYDLETAAASMMSRLSFDDDVTDKYDSMLAFPCCEGQFTSGQLDTVMSVTSRVLPWEVTGSSSPHDSFPGGNDMYRAYKGKLNLEQVHYGEDMKAAENQDFISQGSTNNATCAHAHNAPPAAGRTHAHAHPLPRAGASSARTASTTRSPRLSCP